MRSRPSQPTTANPHLLTGLLYVEGYRYRGDVTRGVRYYTDRKRRKGKPWLELESTDERVWSAFVSLASDAEFVAGLIEKANEELDSNTLEMEIGTCQTTLAKLRRRLDGLLEMRADGEITKQQYLEKAAETEDAIVRAERRRQELAAQIASTDVSKADRVVKAIQVILGGRSQLSLQQKRSVLRSIVRRIDVKASRENRRRGRDDKGRFNGQTGPKWSIDAITFQLAIPNDQDGEPGNGDRGLSPSCSSRDQLSGMDRDRGLVPSS